MPSGSRSSRSITLSIALEERWTLHHVLLHRIEEEQTAANATDVEPPPREVFEAFETLDTGETSFTTAQLEAMRDVLADYHCQTDWWEVERPKIERLLHSVSDPLEEPRSAED